MSSHCGGRGLPGLWMEGLPAGAVWGCGRRMMENEGLDAAVARGLHLPRGLVAWMLGGGT